MKINTERTVDTKRNQPRKEDAGAEPARKRGRPGSFKEAKQAGSPRGEKGPQEERTPKKKARGGPRREVDPTGTVRKSVSRLLLRQQ